MSPGTRQDQSTDPMVSGLAIVDPLLVEELESKLDTLEHIVEEQAEHILQAERERGVAARQAAQYKDELGFEQEQRHALEKLTNGSLVSLKIQLHLASLRQMNLVLRRFFHLCCARTLQSWRTNVTDWDHSFEKGRLDSMMRGLHDAKARGSLQSLSYILRRWQMETVVRAIGCWGQRVKDRLNHLRGLSLISQFLLRLKHIKRWRALQEWKSQMSAAKRTEMDLRESFAGFEKKAVMTAILEGFEQAKAKLTGIRLHRESQSYVYAWYRWRSHRDVSSSLKMLGRVKDERGVRELKLVKKEGRLQLLFSRMQVYTSVIPCFL